MSKKLLIVALVLFAGLAHAQSLAPFVLQVAAAATLPADSDNFNRANGPVGGNWTPFTVTDTPYIASNAVGVERTAYDAGAIWNLRSFGNDQYSQCTVQNLSAAGGHNCYAEIGVRSTSGFNGYWLYCNGGTGAGNFQLSKYSDITTETRLQNFSTTVNAGDILKIQVVGTTIKVFVNGVQVGTDQSDATYTTGSPGFDSYTDSDLVKTIDNWKGGQAQ